MLTRLCCAVLVLGVGFGALSRGPAVVRASDLDDFMERVLARRDENWKKLQQYLLDESQDAQVLGPGKLRIYGFRREYTWYVREGYFVRSPTRFDGVEVSERERRDYEAKWIARERDREKKAAEKAGTSSPEPPREVADVLSQTTEPEFVSAAYFLKFKFERGRYAFAGRERFEGKDVLRIEYYPERLFRDREDQESEGRHHGRKRDTTTQQEDDRITRQMNKVAMVTLWVEPTAHQVLQYTFDNVGFDFLPGKWLVRVSDARASMRMGEVFPEVWLPRAIHAHVAFTLATGTYEIRYDHEYDNHRRAETEVKIR